MTNIMQNKMVTQINTSKEMYFWEIRDFSFNRKDPRKYILSPIFSTDSGDTKWALQMYPKGFNAEKSNCKYVALFLNLIKCKQSELQIEVVFSISASKKNHQYVNVYSFNKIPDRRGTNHFIMIETLLNYLVDDKLTINCEIRNCTETHLTNEPILKSNESLSSATESFSIDSDLEKLSEDFGKLMENQQFGDVTLVAAGEKLKAHKTILAARSSVFLALFSHDVKETKEQLITIEDVEPDALKEMLRFIYTGKVENLDRLAYELLSLSDKYGLDGLKKKCEDCLSNCITVDNAINVLILSDLHLTSTLKKKTLNFIKAHSNTIIDTEEYKTLENNNSPLIAEILRSIVTK